MNLAVVSGDLLVQRTDCIVNAWNRNVIPWWLLLPSGVSGAIKKNAGIGPFVELSKFGPMPLGSARLTSAGKLHFKGIIHVASIDLFWRASEFSIRNSVVNAMNLAHQSGFESIAFPLLGAGAGGFNAQRAESLMKQSLEQIRLPLNVTIVRFSGR